MPRKANPDRVARENMVTRTIRTTTVKIAYVPNGGKSVEAETVTAYGNEQYAVRTARKSIRAKGTIIGEPEIIESSDKLYAMDYADFIANAKVIDLSSSYPYETAETAESEG